MPICVHIGLILTNHIYGTLNIPKIRIYIPEVNFIIYIYIYYFIYIIYIIYLYITYILYTHIYIYHKNKLVCINVIQRCVSVEETHHLINDTGYEMGISRRSYSTRSICVCNILNASRLVYSNLRSHRSNRYEYHIRDVKYT